MALTQISTAGVKDDAVTAGKIPADAVGSSEIAANAVGSSELADNAVDTAAIVNQAVNASKIADGTITDSKLAGSTITSASIANTTILRGKMANNSVGSTEIMDEAVTLAKLEHGTGSNDGKFLRANNGADPSFETVSIPAGTTINGNADHRIVTATGTANTIQGESSFTHNPSTFDTTILHSTNTANDLIIQNDSSGTAAGARLTLQSGSNANTGPQEQFIVGSHSWLRQVPKSSGNMTLAKNGTNHTTFAADGDLVISDGDLVIGTSGHGIDFSATSGSGTSELLDDYEEGNWTPAFEDLSNTPTYYNLAGKYVKIGSFVTIWGMIQIGGTQPTFTNNTHQLKIAGLPFANDATTGYVGGAGPVTFQSWNIFGSTYNDYGANGVVTCGVTNSTRILFAVNPDANGGIRGTARRKSFEGGPIVTWTMSYRTTA